MVWRTIGNALSSAVFVNRYAYANNNPYKFVDPDGHSPLDVAFLAYDIGKLGVALYKGEGIGDALADVALSTVGVISPIPGAGQVLKGVRAADKGVELAIVADKTKDAANHVDDTIYRMGTSNESKARLGNKAQEAENIIGIHGVSGSTTKPNVPCSSASCSSLEAAGFKVTPTPTRNDPNHVTIELPKPVTKEVADKFNKVFGRDGD